MGRRMIAFGAMALLCALVLTPLAGCAGPFQGPAQRLPPLHIAGLKRLDGLSNLNGAYNFTYATPFQQGHGQWQVLLGSDAVASEDGSGFRRLTLPYMCDSLERVSADGQWIVCFNSDANTGASYMDVASLDASMPHAQWQMPVDALFLYYPVFAVSPDGGYIALVESTGTDCMIEVRQFVIGHASSVVALTLSSPAFHLSVQFGGCPVTGLAWSSDGARLSVVLYNAWDEAVPIAHLLQTHVATSVIPQSAFRSFLANGIGYPAYAPAINPRDGRITLSGFTGLVIATPGIVRASVSSITFPSGNNLDYRVWSAEWTPDGQSLLLLIGPPGCTDHCGWANYTRDLYLYTPGAA